MLAEKIAVVTGGSRGIGRAVARELARNGAKVLINYVRNAAAAEETCREIAATGSVASAFQADVSEEEGAQALITRAVEQWGGIDILVNNAGITRDKLLVNMSLDEWETVMATNLRGAFLCTKYTLKFMLRRRYGKVINITSISGILGNAGQANYAAAKAGLIGLTMSVAQEYGPRGICSNAVAPGFIDTEMTRAVPEEVQRQKVDQVLLRRYGLCADVAGAVLFLSSPMSDYVNGTVLRVDGGIRF